MWRWFCKHAGKFASGFLATCAGAVVTLFTPLASIIGTAYVIGAAIVSGVASAGSALTWRSVKEGKQIAKEKAQKEIEALKKRNLEAEKNNEEKVNGATNAATLAAKLDAVTVSLEAVKKDGQTLETKINEIERQRSAEQLQSTRALSDINERINSVDTHIRTQGIFSSAVNNGTNSTSSATPRRRGVVNS